MPGSGGRKPLEWEKLRQPKRKPPPPLPHLLPPKAIDVQRSPLRRLFRPSSPTFDDALMTDDAREQFAQDADAVE